jgi:hypothetical protein
MVMLNQLHVTSDKPDKPVIRHSPVICNLQADVFYLPLIY